MLELGHDSEDEVHLQQAGLSHRAVVFMRSLYLSACVVFLSGRLGMERGFCEL